MNSQGLSQRQVQTMRLSPQQILYAKLLQLPIAQLDQRIKQELEENPLLEEVTEEDSPLDVQPNEVEKNGEIEKILPKSEQEIVVENPPADTVPKPNEQEQKVVSEDFDGEVAEYFTDDEEGYKVPSFRDVLDDDYVYQPVYHESFSERLLQDLRLQNLSEKELLIAEEVIGNIEGDGYLRCPMEVICDGLMSFGLVATEEEIESVLEKIWYLDPPGIGARSLQECLIIQLKVLCVQVDDEEDERCCMLAIEILSHYYTDFTMMRFEKLTQQLGVTMEDLRRTMSVIQKLNPKPGGEQSASSNYITPDFMVTFNGHELIATSSDRSALQIRISSKYRCLLDDKKQPKPAKEFVRNKLDAAKNFMTAIEMRRQTLSRVMNAILKLQYDFFAVGPHKLKPMILKDVAEDAGVDISTVSRVVNGKYVQAHKGVWELKYFFSASVSTDSGDEVSNRIIKQNIKDMIEGEDTARPLSDDKIAEVLNKKGFRVARRTVAKYREQLNIPVARLRKRIDSLG
jgi:RNA polymerase sigma-54 factor